MLNYREVVFAHTPKITYCRICMNIKIVFVLEYDDDDDDDDEEDEEPEDDSKECENDGEIFVDNSN